MAKTAKKKVPSPKARGKICLMAVEPFQSANIEPLVRLARAFSEPMRGRVEAAYVLAPASMNWTGEFSGPWVKRYLPIAKAKLSEILPSEVAGQHVLVCKAAGQRAAVKSLVQFAQRKKVGCLVITTHQRKGLERWVMGSFAESLILVANVPVLLVNPAQTVPSAVRKILMPVDLGPKCEKNVAAMGVVAKALNAEVVLYHRQDDPLAPIVQQGVYTLGGGWMSMQSYSEDEQYGKTKRLEKLAAILQRSQVKASHILDSSPGGLVEGIQSAAKESGADLISIFTHAGAVGAAVLGSVARGLVRSSTIPLLVQR